MKKGIFAILIFLLYNFTIFACTIAVISGKATTDGRPIIFKTRDERDEYRQEVKYYPPTGDEKYGHMSVVKWGLNNNPIFPDVINGAGINETGFMITNTTVYSNLLAESINSNMPLLNYAIPRCKTLEDFENILGNWHKIKNVSTISGNFAVVDANGKAAIYEINKTSPILTKIRWEKFSADDAYDENGNFLGFVVRTNDNQFSPYTGGSAREERANEILKKLALNNNINQKTIMRELSRDVCGDVEKVNIKELKEEGITIDEELENKDIYNFYTEECISRYNTNFAFVGRGIKKGEDKRLITMWVNLGEPSVGIFTPFFPLSKKVPLYAWADELPEENNVNIIDENSSSIMNNLIATKGELAVYDNLEVGLGPLGLTVTEGIDRTINYAKTLEIQDFVFPVEDIIIDETEKFLDMLREQSNIINSNLLYRFSDYAIRYAYDNYNMIDSDKPNEYRQWDFTYYAAP
ncbi:MAG: hypothetical protein SVN78_02900 [Deferribacterota bacterium]|nr:hypothetical protein [Deferribacterota bacterium]